MTADYRYGEWSGGRDPLAPPFDVMDALDELGDKVLEGASARDALRALLRRGSRAGDLRGLDDLARKAHQRRCEARRRGRLDGTLEQVKELLDAALEQERQKLFFEPDEDARLAESELAALPNDTARAVRELASYDWRSPRARATYQQIQDLLRREVLDSSFKGIKDALTGSSPQDMARVKDMLADLNAMLEAAAQGEHTQEQFDAFMAKHGEFFPDQPANLEELVDSLARRAAAAQRLLDSLSPEQRAELAELMSAALADMGLAAEMARLGDALRAMRPNLAWGGRERMSGAQPLGLGDATSALEEMAELDELEAALGQDYPGASLDDIDPAAVERALGRQAVDDVERLRQVERELERQGYLTRDNGTLGLSPKAVRRLGATALRRVFARLEAHGRGGHDVADAGAAGELVGTTREWQFGDEQPFDVVRTVSNAVLRTGRGGAALLPPRSPAGSPQRGGADGGVRLAVEDFEVVETERRTCAAVCLLVDLSYSMALRGTWGEAKSTALALHSLVTTKYPQDSIEIIGFSNYARVLQPAELAGLSWDMVQGTNLQHALVIAQRHLSRHPDAEPVILCVTDGEPTAHLLRDGRSWFDWPPAPETLELTMAEVERVTRRGATINVFMLHDDPRLIAFVEQLARRNGGRVFAPSPDRLGDYVVSDYIRARRGRRGQ